MWCLNLPLSALINNMLNCFPFPPHSWQMECCRCDWTTLMVFMLQTNGVTVCRFLFFDPNTLKTKQNSWKFIGFHFCLCCLLNFYTSTPEIWAHLKVNSRTVVFFFIAHEMHKLENGSFESNKYILLVLRRTVIGIVALHALCPLLWNV